MLTTAVRSALVLLSSYVPRDVHLHQLLSHRPNSLAQKVHVILQLGLAPQLEKHHPQVLGHRSVPSFGDLDNPDTNRRWPSASTADVKSPHVGGLNSFFFPGASASA